MQNLVRTFSVRLLPLAAAVLHCVNLSSVRADETCMSPYMPKITGQEDFVYVWTLGVDGLGDASDKLVTIDVKPGSSNYGKIIHSASVGGQHEAHHGGFTDDRRHFWLSGLDTSHIFIFDIASDPARPKLVKKITDFPEKTGGAVGPHGMYALPGRMLIPSLSNTKDKTGRTCIVEYSNEGEFVRTYWMPTKEQPFGAEIESVADGYGYDCRVLPRKNVMLSSSFTGWSNYMREFGDVAKDPEAMNRFGQTMVLWNLHTRQPRKVFHVPGAPLEVRWAWGPQHNYAFSTTALGGKIWLIYEDAGGEWKAKDVGSVGEGLLPVDISLSADDNLLFVDTFGDGKCRVFDVSDPMSPKKIHEAAIGKQVNMVSQSWDGKRLYFTSSLLSKWDKKGDDNEQFFKAYGWNGKELQPKFAIDFTKEKLGRPHLMRLGAANLYN